MKKCILPLLILSLLLCGCGKADALCEAVWQRTEPLPAGTGETFLAALDFTAEEIALAAPNDPAIVEQLAFADGGTYRLSCDAEATRALTREYLDGFLTALCADPAALSGVYDAAFGVDMATMSEADCRDFYAGIFGCEDYDGLLDHLTNAFFDYETLAVWEETGTCTLRGGKLFLADAAGAERGYVEYELSENALTLIYADKTLEYRKTA